MEPNWYPDTCKDKTNIKNGVLINLATLQATLVNETHTLPRIKSG